MKKLLLVVTIQFFLATNAFSQSWHTVGSGIGAPYYSNVMSFADYNNDLYIAGNFSNAGGITAANIAKCNGSNWTTVGTGVNGSVNSMCVYNGELYVGGNFTTAGGIAAIDIARWNGTNWNNVGSPDCYTITAMVVYNGELYAAGYFVGLTSPEGTTIAKWNGSSWSAVGNGPEPVITYIECLAVYNGELFAAGPEIGGGGGANSFSVVKWNGTAWSTLITLPTYNTPDGGIGNFYSMAVYGGELYVAGRFTMMIGNIAASQVVKWDGTSWSAVGSGIKSEVYPMGGDSDGAFYTFVQTLAVHQGLLYAGGRFDSCGVIETRNIARWDGLSWSAVGLGVNGDVYSLISHDSSLYAGGIFNLANGNLPVNKIAKWSESCAGLPQPVFISGSSQSCAGSSQVYTVAPVPGAVDYSWTLPAGWTGSSTTNLLTATVGSASGTVWVTANNNCGGNAAQSWPVTVIKTPLTPTAITGNSVVCAGSTQTYSIVPAAGVDHYSWTLPTGWTGQSTAATIEATVGTTGGNVVVTATNTCGTSSPRILPVSITPFPARPGSISGNQVVNVGQVITYSIQTVDAAEGYSWSLNGGGNILSGQNTTAVSVHWFDAGNHTLVVNSYNSCGYSANQSKTITVSASTTVSNPDSLFELTIVPNPSRGKFYLKAVGLTNKQTRIEVTNAIGQVVFVATPIIGTGTYYRLIDLEKQSPGVYWVRFRINNKVYIQAISKVN